MQDSILANKPVRSAFRAALCVLGIGLSPAANALSHSFTDLGTGSFASAINDVGQVVGSQYTDTARHAMLWSDGVAVDLGLGAASGINNLGQVVGSIADHTVIWNGTTPTYLLDPIGAQGAGANGINDSGQVVGWGTINNDAQAILWNGTTPTLLASAGPSAAQAINNSGQIAGASRTRFVFPYIQATIWDGGIRTEFQRLGDYEAYGHAINDLGVVVGGSYVDVPGLPYDELHAIAWNGTDHTDLGGTGTFSEAWGINNLGQIVGFSDGRATLWQDGAMIDLNTFLDASTVSAGWVLDRARDINNQGWIVGSAFNNVTGERSAYVLAPVAALPEPEICAMMLTGLGVLGWVARRKKLLERAAA